MLAAIEPLTGRRLATVQPQRTKQEYAHFLQELAQAYPQATKIRLVQDNLNTHNTSSLYEHLPAAQAFAIAQRFEFYYTPKSASWLNMIEIEFAAVSRQCLNRRIPTQHQLEQEVLALLHARQAKQLKITWQFSLTKARAKFETHYQRLLPSEENTV